MTSVISADGMRAREKMKRWMWYLGLGLVVIVIITALSEPVILQQVFGQQKPVTPP